MNTHTENTPSLRTGARRVIPPWEFHNLRLWARMRPGGGIFLAACFLLTLGLGGNNPRTYAWAGLFLLLGALALAGGYWELRIARSATSRT